MLTPLLSRCATLVGLQEVGERGRWRQRNRADELFWGGGRR